LLQKFSGQNFPDKFTPIDWTGAKKAWNQCERELDRAVNELNVSGRNDPSDDEEVAQYNFAKFTKHAYVEYWHFFNQQNNLLFKSMNSPLPKGAFRESSTPDSFSSAVTNKKRKVAESAETSMQHHSQYQQDSLELQRTIMQQQKDHQEEIMQQQKQHQQEMGKCQQQNTLTLQSAMRREEIRMLELDNNLLNKTKFPKNLVFCGNNSTITVNKMATTANRTPK
jgi:hypothetical protein